MIRFLRDFAGRWKWLLLIQLIVSAAGWAFSQRIRPQHGGGGVALEHLEFGVAVAMSWDLLRGLNRACLVWPVTRKSLARGMWLAVAGIGPFVSSLAVLPGLLYCMAAGLPLPSWSILSLHVVLSFLLGGTLQFVLTGLRIGIAPTLGGQVRDGFFGMLWGLSLSATGWLGLVIPMRWEDIHTGGAVILGFMAMITVISWFTTPGMVVARAAPAVGGRGRSAVPGVTNTELRNSLLQGVSGWPLWLGLELRWLAFLPLMVALVIGVLRGIGRLSSPGVEAAVVAGPNQYTSLGMLCAMLLLPMFSMSCGPLRAFAAMPVRRVSRILLMVLRPPVYALVMCAAFLLLNHITGQANSGILRAACLFALIGSLTSLLQSFLIRWPSFAAVIALGAVLAPTAMLLFPLLLRQDVPVLWLPIASAGILLLAAALHLRWLRTSTTIYRSIPWLQRYAAGVTGR
ncbi:MAG: hypothetical protein JWM59_4289 [Verrucomicrobiales bacterium]|nr:hypothetical protein [Verrucomicrobiales bacterium]